MELSAVYFPSAVLIGALHALEPGHAKTLTAAYLIGTKGTKRDATLLGLSVAFTHSIVVVALSLGAVLLGREAFTDEASSVLAVGSSIVVMALGAWLLKKRIATLRRADLPISCVGELTPIEQRASRHQFVRSSGMQHHHDHMTDDEHARAHAADLPAYVHTGDRPSVLQILTFGAAGGLVPCPAAISVMLLSLSVSQSGRGLILVLGFSLGLAITLVGVGLLVVTGLTKLSDTGRLSRFSKYAPSLAAGMVILSGAVGLIASFY